VNGGERRFQEDPYWRDYIPFFEYFHGDSGAGIGASHQTGWTGVIARLMHLFATTSAERLRDFGKVGMTPEDERKDVALAAAAALIT
jgi:hypothetical protein